MRKMSLTAEKAQYVVGGASVRVCRVYIRSAPHKSAETVRNTDPGDVVASEGTVETGDGDKWIKLDGKPHYMMLFDAEDRVYAMRKKS